MCYTKAHDTERIGFLDIEATSLNASFGYMLSYCIKRRGGEVLKRPIAPADIRAHRFDRNLCKQFLEDLGEFDRLVTYYGTGYDVPFLRTRCLHHKLDFPPMGSVFHTDLYYSVRGKLKLHRNRLEVACDILDIPSKGHRLTPPVWMKAQAGDKASIDYVLQHNVEDVESLEALWDRLYGNFRVNKTSI
jgi:uncharacterized protein YprB with RNaseH-like and TPR domain